MPIYIYECSNLNCGEFQEIIRPKENEYDTLKCPDCRSGMFRMTGFDDPNRLSWELTQNGGYS